MGEPFLVICKYAKDTDWAKHEHAIIHNGVDRENKGREPAAWLWWLHNNDIDPDRTYVFLQDFPYDHCSDWEERINDVRKYTPLGNSRLECNGEGVPHHPGLPVKECYERWLKRDFPYYVDFVAGGQFAIPGEHLLRYEKHFYKYLEEEANSGDNCYVFERIWGHLFDFD